MKKKCIFYILFLNFSKLNNKKMIKRWIEKIKFIKLKKYSVYYCFTYICKTFYHIFRDFFLIFINAIEL